MNINVKLKKSVSLLYGNQRVVLINSTELERAKNFLKKYLDSDILAFIFSFERTQLLESHLLETFNGFEKYEVSREMDVMFFLQHIQKSVKPKIFKKLKEKYPVNFIFTT